MTNTADQDTAKAAATNTTGSNTSLSAHQLAIEKLQEYSKENSWNCMILQKSQINALWSRNYSKPAKYNWEKLKEEILNYYDAEWDAAQYHPQNLIDFVVLKKKEPCLNLAHWKKYYREYKIPEELQNLLETKLVASELDHNVNDYELDHFDKRLKALQRNKDHKNRKLRKEIELLTAKLGKDQTTKYPLLPTEEQSCVTHYKGTPEEIDSLIHELNTMSLNDPTYGEKVYKVLRLDKTGNAAKYSSSSNATYPNNIMYLISHFNHAFPQVTVMGVGRMVT
ncbi:hypothetical protein BDQ17DRAFT_1329822 [Cyathus striatus]|nr:hypothetical protein BDQ17DRAFT_1329822 [Cyathus striatus]